MIVKVCGITNTRDALVSLDAGADALGFNFWPGSKRYLKETDFLRDLPSNFWRVGLFVEEDPQRVRDTMAEFGLDIAQLHRMDNVSGLRIWHAISADGPLTQAQIDAAGAEAVLVDTPSGALAGGTGQTFDWKFLEGLSGNIVLAGGLDASNVGQAVEMLRPWGIDACSRLEAEAGKKDPKKVWDFVNAARAAERKAV